MGAFWIFVDCFKNKLFFFYQKHILFGHLQLYGVASQLDQTQF